MGLFTLNICCTSCSLDYLKSYLESKRRLSIPNLTQICLELLAKMNLNINLSNFFWIDYRTLNATGYFAILVQL